MQRAICVGSSPPSEVVEFTSKPCALLATLQPGTPAKMFQPREWHIKDLRHRVMQETAGPALMPFLAEVVARSSHEGASRIQCHVADQAARVASLNMHRVNNPMWPPIVASHFRAQRIRLDRVLARYIVRDWRLYHKCDSLCTDTCSTVCTKTKRLCHLCQTAPVGPTTSPELTPGRSERQRMIMPSELPEGRELLRQIADCLGDPSFLPDIVDRSDSVSQSSK